MILTSILTISLFIFWILGLWCFPPNFDARSYTHEIFYITGAIAWLWMAICLVIAARPSWIEKVFRLPLDRLYVFHKWLGFAAVAMAFVHYFVKDIFGPILRLIWTLPKPPKKEVLADPAFLGFGVVYEPNCGKRVFRMAYLDSFDSCASLSNEEDSL